MSTESIRVDDEQSGRLLGVQVFARHGARTPMFLIPNMTPKVDWDSESFISDVPYTQIPYKLCHLSGGALDPKKHDMEAYIKSIGRTVKSTDGPGKITSRGLKDCYELGKKLRERYVNRLQFISPKYDPRQVYFRSTYFQRTILTVRCIAAGLFKSADDEILHYLQEDPINFHIAFMEDEIFVINRLVCKPVRSISHLPANTEKADFVQLREKTTRVLGEKSMGIDVEMKGRKLHELFHLFFVRDDLSSRLHHDVPMSDEVRQVLEEMNRICSDEYTLALFSENMSEEDTFKASAGPMLDHIATILKKQSEESGSHRFHFTSLHDETIICLIKALHMFDGLWPMFGAYFLLELWETADAQRWVHVVYCDQVLARLKLDEMFEKLKKYSTTREEYLEICKREP